MRQTWRVTDFLDLAVLSSTVRSVEQWRQHFADLGSFATEISFTHSPEAFANEGADIASIRVNGVLIEAAEGAANDIRFSAEFPDGRCIYGGETIFDDTESSEGIFRLRRVPEATREARSALNALLVFATMKAIASAVSSHDWDSLRRAGGIDSPTGRLDQIDEG